MKQAEDEPSQPEQARHRRGDVSIADMVTAAVRLGVTDPADLAAIGRALDVTIPVTPVVPPSRPTPVPTEPSQTTSAPMSSARTTRNRAGPTGTPVAARLRQEDDAGSIPAWLAAVSALPPPDSGRFGVPPEPPLPTVQARSSMAALAATWRPSRRLDLVRLVRRSARLQPLTACFLTELRTASFVQLLVDRGEGMEPYADDLEFLAAQIVDVAGRDRVEQRTFAGTPQRGLDPDVFTGETTPWRRPAPDSLVLILTDLGLGGPAGSRDRAQAGEWRAVAATVASVQAELRVLTPFPPSRLPTGLAAMMRIVSWDSLVYLVQLRG